MQYLGKELIHNERLMKYESYNQKSGLPNFSPLFSRDTEKEAKIYRYLGEQQYFRESSDSSFINY